MMAKLMIDSAVVWARDHRIDLPLRPDGPPAARGDGAAAARRECRGRPPHPPDRRRLELRRGGQRRALRAGLAAVAQRQRHRHLQRPRARRRARRQRRRQRRVDQIQQPGLRQRPALRPQRPRRRPRSRADLLRGRPGARAGLAGSLRGYHADTHTGDGAAGAIDYAGQPAGYVRQPARSSTTSRTTTTRRCSTSGLQAAAGTRREDRARVQVLAARINAFSQGIAYVHAGRNCCAASRWTATATTAATGSTASTGRARTTSSAPACRRRRTTANWPLMRPLLADASIKPDAGRDRFARDAFLDLLKIRASTTLLRLRTPTTSKQRLRFHNTGPDQLPTVLVGHWTAGLPRRRPDQRRQAGAHADDRRAEGPALHAAPRAGRAGCCRCPRQGGPHRHEQRSRQRAGTHGRGLRAALIPHGSRRCNLGGRLAPPRGPV
jgi:pullulanase